MPVDAVIDQQELAIVEYIVLADESEVLNLHNACGGEWLRRKQRN